jgi:uncharacterized protein
MSFCPICGANHDPKMPCFDRAGEILRDLGIPKKKQTSRRHSKTTLRKSHFPDIIDASFIVLCVYLLKDFIARIVFSNINPSTPHKYLLGVIVTVLSSVIIISAIMVLNKSEYTQLFHFSHIPVPQLIKSIIIPLAVACLGLITLDSILGSVTTFLFPLSDHFKSFLSWIDTPSILSIVYGVVLSPVLEEILYRGIFLKSFIKQYKVSTALVASSFLFAILHGNIHQGVQAFLGGIFFGWLFIQAQSLWPTIIAHFILNSLSICGFGSVKITKFFMINDDLNTIRMLIFGAAGVTLFVVGIMFLSKNLGKANESLKPIKRAHGH